MLSEGPGKAALPEPLCRCKGLYQTKVLAGEMAGQAGDIHLEAEQLSCSVCIHFSLQAAPSTANRSVPGYLRLGKAALMLNVCVGPSLVKEKLPKAKMEAQLRAWPSLCFCLSQQKLWSAQLGLVGVVSCGSSMSHRGWHPPGQHIFHILHIAGAAIFHILVI